MHFYLHNIKSIDFKNIYLYKKVYISISNFSYICFHSVFDESRINQIVMEVENRSDYPVDKSEKKF